MTSQRACVFQRACSALGESGEVRDDICRSSLFYQRGSGQSPPPAADATLLTQSAGFSSLASRSRPIRCIVSPVASVKYDRRAAQHYKSTKSSPRKLWRSGVSPAQVHNVFFFSVLYLFIFLLLFDPQSCITNPQHIPVNSLLNKAQKQSSPPHPPHLLSPCGGVGALIPQDPSPHLPTRDGGLFKQMLSLKASAEGTSS